jgi:hypothetical protein
MLLSVRHVIVGLVLLACPLSAVAQGLLPSIELKMGPYTVYAEVAATDATRAKGLMYRESLPDDRGMLFAFDAPNGSCFWMKNTPLPLSIAFISASGVILNIENMQPQSTQSHCPVAPMRYALEMKQGWFQKHGIRPGSRVEQLP